MIGFHQVLSILSLEIWGVSADVCATTLEPHPSRTYTYYHVDRSKSSNHRRAQHRPVVPASPIHPAADNCATSDKCGRRPKDIPNPTSPIPPSIAIRWSAIRETRPLQLSFSGLKYRARSCIVDPVYCQQHAHELRTRRRQGRRAEWTRSQTCRSLSRTAALSPRVPLVIKDF